MKNSASKPGLRFKKCLVDTFVLHEVGILSFSGNFAISIANKHG